MEAGRRAFAAKGLAGTNVKNDILAPAGVSVGSFYHQFRDKTELLLAIMEDHARAFRDRLMEIHRPKPGKTIRDIARDSYAMILDDVEENADLMRIQLRERGSDDERVRLALKTAHEQWTARLAEDYQRIAMASGVQVEADLLASLTVGLALGAMAQYLELPYGRRRALRERLLDGLVRFTLGGVPAFLRPDQAVVPLESFEPPAQRP